MRTKSERVTEYCIACGRQIYQKTFQYLCFIDTFWIDFDQQKGLGLPHITYIVIQ